MPSRWCSLSRRSRQDRYYSLQFVDGYTYNFAYVGSRTTGNGGGKYLLAGPNWKGDKPEGINEVIRSDTELAMVLYRTQLFGPSDLDSVKKIQAGYQVTPLSVFLNQPPPTPAPPIDFVPPLTPDQQKTSPQFFEILSFALRFAPTLPSEKDLRARFATIGIGPDGDFDSDKLSPEMRTAIEGGMADAWAEFNTLKKDKIDTGEVGSAQFFGTAADLKGNYLYRMAGAVLGIYGNTAAEAIYPSFSNDSAGAPLTGANKYTFRFAPGQLPPVNAFWSLTMYELPQSLLVANPMNRYLINSPMLPSLVADPDGGYTFYVQNESPGPDEESNWLPAPSGPVPLVLRLYWPKPDALNGVWKAPAAGEGLTPSPRAYRVCTRHAALDVTMRRSRRAEVNPGSRGRGGAGSARTRRPARRRRSCRAPRSCRPRRRRVPRVTARTRRSHRPRSSSR